MVTQTESIVLSTIKYGENSIIAKVYTKEYGLLNIIASSAKKKGVKVKNYFHPLSNLKVAIYFKQKQSLHRLKEVDFIEKSSNIESNVAINALKFFLAELLTKLIGEEETNEKLYFFIKEEIKTLNLLNKDYRYFHLNFLYKLSKHLGIEPNFCEKGKFFDLREAQMVDQTPLHSDYIDENKLTILKNYFCKGNKVTKKEISLILDTLLAFYNIHMGGLNNLKSREVMEVVFS